MARQLNLLNVKQIPTLEEGKLHSDGGGLYLSTKGAPRWVFIWRRGGGRREMSLGPAENISLATARKKAAAARALLADGADPLEERRAAKAAAVAPKKAPTFELFAATYIDEVEGGWRSAVHRQQWRSSLRDHAAAIMKRPVDEITTDDILQILRPIWLTKSETAMRVRGRIEKILDAAKAKGVRPQDSMNPAAWRGHLALLLPKQSKLSRGHHAALSYTDVSSFWTALASRPALAARCLEFTILTAARSGEALGATWGEIDTENARWTVPAHRMKGGVEHVVPLPTHALTILEKLRPPEPKACDIIFAVGGAARSNMAMAMLLRRMGHGDVTVHGFRSTFRDWAGDTTSYPREIVEQALAHAVGDDVERAYRRRTAIERRRELMQAWAEFVNSSKATTLLEAAA